MVSRRLASSSAGGLLYGAIVTAAVLVATGGHASDRRIVVIWGVVIGTYWLTHVYVEAAEQQFHGDRRHLLRRSLTAARTEVPVLLGGVPAMVVFLVSTWVGEDDVQAAMIALLATVVLLATVGYLGTRYAGHGRPAAWGEAAAAAALGLVMVATKSLLH